MIVMEFAILFTKWLTNQQGQACMTFFYPVSEKENEVGSYDKI